MTRSQEIYAARKEQGLCTRCGKRPPIQGFLCAKCHTRYRQTYRRHHERLKEEVFRAYGGCRCSCCNETKDIRFLHIDHVDGGGRVHRRSLPTQGSDGVYRWLKKNRFPKGFQVLCADCNLAKGFYGRCPHEEQRESRLLQFAGVGEGLLC